ncbi:MAG TPA: F0F1 ATP synthase subunit A [Chthoniobacterales bacterium]
MRAFASANFLRSGTGLWIACLLLSIVWWVPAHAESTPHDAQQPASAEHAVEPTSHDDASHEVHHDSGLPLSAPYIFRIGPLPITNSMILCWTIALGIIVSAQIAMRNVRAVPRGAQNFWEWIVESLHNFLESIIGPELVKKTFWFFATVFIFILFTNWFSLIPGVGSIGWGVPDAHGRLGHLTRPILRGGNADLNMTFAMAMVFFACWTVWALQVNGPGGFFLHIFGPKGDTAGFLKMLMILVFIGVGLLEVITIIFRPVTLSFRLFGNIFAGENLLEYMALTSPTLGWLVALPFYLLELLVGFVQAFVFMLLTAVFTLLICQHDEDHAAHEGH